MNLPTDRPSSSTTRHDRGFTLVELLIVIVILGILAVVAVFAVRGITDKGQENAEATDLSTLETAVDAYWLENGSNPTEADLVAAGLLTEESTLHDLAVAGDGSYSITNVRTGAVVSDGSGGGGGGGGGGGTPGSDPNVADMITYAGLPAESYAGAGAAFTIVGYDEGFGDVGIDFSDYVSANPPPAGIELIRVMTQGDTANEVAAVLAEDPDMIIASVSGTAGEMFRAERSVWGHVYAPGSGAEIQDAIAHFNSWQAGAGSATPIEFARTWGYQVGPSNAGRTIAVLGIGPASGQMKSEFDSLNSGALPSDVRVLYLDLSSLSQLDPWYTERLRWDLEAFPSPEIQTHGVIFDADAPATEPLAEFVIDDQFSFSDYRTFTPGNLQDDIDSLDQSMFIP